MQKKKEILNQVISSNKNQIIGQETKNIANKLFSYSNISNKNFISYLNHESENIMSFNTNIGVLFLTPDTHIKKSQIMGTDILFPKGPIQKESSGLALRIRNIENEENHKIYEIISRRRKVNRAIMAAIKGRLQIP